MKTTGQDQTLRQRVEMLMDEGDHEPDPVRTEMDSQTLLHELKVHQIELAMQNDELRLAQDEVRAGLAQYQELYDYAPVGYFSFDCDGTIRKLNLTGAGMLKLDRSHLIGRRFQNWLSVETRVVFSDFLERLFQKKISQACELALLPQGNLPLFVRIEAQTSAAEELCFAAVMDISERKRAEDALRVLDASNRNLVEASLDPHCTIAPDGIIVDVNSAAENISGYGREELIGSCFADYFTDPHKAREGFQLVIAEGTVRNYPLQIRHRNGQVSSVLYNASLFRDETGEPQGVFVAARDITEQKKLEAQLFQAQKMEAIGQLAGGIAHDFNNLITGIIGYSALIEMHMAQDDPQRERLNHVIAAAERGADLTKSLLAFSRKQVINLQPIDLNRIVNKTENFLKRIIGEDIEFRMVSQQGVLIVHADSGQIEQVLMNLATNARDAMPNGGVFSIETSSVVMDADFITAHGYGEAGEYALLSISDNGLGMDERARKRLFEPFFTTKELGRGTGLGLSIVYGIVKQHNGYINVYSEPGSGTTFTIYLPLLSEVVAPSPDHVEEEVLAGGTETILVADDNGMVLSLTEKVLKRFGYTVLTAIDGRDAVEKFSASRDTIALVILDVIMPKMNGKEALDEIRKICPEVKALFVSGYTADIIHKRGTLDGSLEFLAKPLRPVSLLRKVRDVLDGVTRDGKNGVAL